MPFLLYGDIDIGASFKPQRFPAGKQKGEEALTYFNNEKQ